MRPPQGVQNIISGWQTMTVFKDVRKLATVAAKAAVQLVKGQKPTTTGTSRRRAAAWSGRSDPAAVDHEVQLQAAVHRAS